MILLSCPICIQIWLNYIWIINYITNMKKSLANTYPNDTNVHQYQVGVSCTTMLIELFAHYSNVISKWHKCATMDHICASSMIKV